ncbi:MAG: FAD:protein FMN transferase [Actinomycetota bacterium]|nr:FAD:protein FMN transferase [Actinomycetota bacterium]
MTAFNSTFAEAKFEALGTKCHVILFGLGPYEVDAATTTVQQEVDRYDSIFSVYRSDSEITKVNVSQIRTIAVSCDFAQLTSVYLEKYSSSGGLIDPTTGYELIELYARSNPLVAQLNVEKHFRPVGFEEFSVDLTEGAAEAQLTRPIGAFLDFGGLGKAWIADRIAGTLTSNFGGGVLVNLGGDIATSGAVPSSGWTIKITDDFSLDPSAPGGSVQIFGGGVATSSLVTRRWSDGFGKARLHVVGTDLETSSIVTVTAVGVSALEANYHSLSALILRDGAVPWLIRRRTPALVRTIDGRGLAVSGWPTSSEASDDHLIGAN